MKPLRKWKVLPHGPIEEIDDGILTVTGEIPMPFTKLARRMTVVRLADRRLVIYSAIALDERRMMRIEAFGKPAFLVVPGDHHRLDARIWKDRYPAIVVVAPEGAREKVAEVVPVDTTAPDFGDPNVRFVTVPGVGEHEAALLVETLNGTTLIVNDIVANIRNAEGFGGWFLKKTGFAGEKPQIPTVVRVKDPEALRDQLMRWSEIDSLRRILVSHGSRIENDARNTLRTLAGSL